MLDPVITARLIDDIARATARLQAYSAGTEPDDEEMTQAEVVAIAKRSADTVKRWAKEEGFGIKVDGVWLLRRSLLRQGGKI